jgi:hypothetical protein
MEDIIATVDDMTEYFTSLRELLATVEDERDPGTEDVAKVAVLSSISQGFAYRCAVCALTDFRIESVWRLHTECDPRELRALL